MQTVVHPNNHRYIHSIFSLFDKLYEETSTAYYVYKPSLVPFKYPKVFNELFALLVTYGCLYIPESQLDETTNVSAIDDSKCDSNTVLVCFSGGKDSYATAQYYKEQGRNVVLYHLKGLNKSYCGKHAEIYTAEKGAEKLQLPLIVEEVKLIGWHNWIEHPLKNMILMSFALNYALTHNLTTQIAVGTFTTSVLEDNAFSVCGGDCIEMWEAYEHILQTVVPSFKILIPNETYETAFKLIQKDSDILNNTISCMTSNQHRQQFRDRTIKKYQIDLLPGRCGCCWKCAVEYIWCVDHNIFELNKPYYIHCLEVLSNTTRFENMRVYTIDELWLRYFFYPMDKSVMYEEIKDAIISGSGKIKNPNNSTKR